MKLVSLSLLTFAADAFISVAFGVVSFVAPDATFGDLVSLQEPNRAVLLWLTQSVSLLYLLFGVVCAVAVFADRRTKRLLAGVMALRHAVFLAVGFGSMNQSWFVGDPYPDLAIQTALIGLYLVSIVRRPPPSE